MGRGKTTATQSNRNAKCLCACAAPQMQSMVGFMYVDAVQIHLYKIVYGRRCSHCGSYTWLAHLLPFSTYVAHCHLHGFQVEWLTIDWRAQVKRQFSFFHRWWNWLVEWWWAQALRRRLKLHSVRSIVHSFHSHIWPKILFMNIFGRKWIDAYCRLMLKWVQIIRRALAWHFAEDSDDDDDDNWREE